MGSPKVSILVPVYKVPEKLLRQCLDSLISQTLREIEIILVDDGSPDHCGALCDEYAADDRVRVLHKQNEGLAAARNSAYDAATGTTVLFVDGDDYLEKDCCERAYDALVSHDVQMVFFNSMREYAHSREPYFTADEDQRYDAAQCKDLLVRALTFNNRLSHVFGKLIRRDFLEKHNIRHIDALKQGGEEFVFCIPLFDHLDSAYFLAAPLYHYVFNEESITHTPNEENYYLTIRCFEYVEAYLQQNKGGVERQLLVRVLYVVCTTAISGYFSPTNDMPWQEKIAGMTRFLQEPLVHRAMRTAQREQLDAQRRIVLFLLAHKLWRAVHLLGRLRAQQLRSH